MKNIDIDSDGLAYQVDSMSTENEQYLGDFQEFQDDANDIRDRERLNPPNCACRIKGFPGRPQFD